MIKKFMDFAVKAQSKGWIGKLYGKLALRLGQSIAIKAAAFIGGLTVPGIGTAVALISLASLAYDAYNIYEAIFGENGILDELEKEDKLNNVSQTPPQTPTDNTTPTPVPYNAAADSQAANTTSVKATPTAPSSAGAYRGQRSDMSPTKSSTTPVTTGSGGAAFGMYPKPGGIQSDLMAAFAQEGITDEKTQIALLANIKKESGFKPISENLNYTSTARLKEVFPSRTKNLSDEELKRYTNNPQGLAELVYGGRMGNAEPGDGFKYRGRGFIQLTGKNNYASMGAALNLPLVDNPDLANDPVVAARIAARYIKDANLQKSFNTQEEANRAVTQSIGGSNLNLNSGYGASLLSKVNSYAGDISLASSAGTSSPNPVVASASAPYSTPASSPDLKMPTMGTLAAAAPTMGDMIEAATSAFSDITRVFDTAMASVTNVTNNNTQSSAGGQQSQGALPSVYDDVFLSLFQRVT
jgi:predicted chitinase